MNPTAPLLTRDLHPGDVAAASRWTPGSAIAAEQYRDFAGRVQQNYERNLAGLRNGIKFAAGIDRPGLGLSPKDTVWTLDKAELWRYRSDQRRFGPPVLLVMSLVSRSYIFDLRPGNSLVEFLLHRGFDVYVLDWGVPDHLEAEHTLSTYADEYVAAAVDAVRDVSHSPDVTMIGYCFGGVLALLYAAGHPGPQVRNLITMATPVDQRHMGPMASLTADGRLEPETLLGPDGNVPPDIIENSFKLLKPTSELSGYVTLWDNLWNDAYVETYQAINGWGHDQIPLAGAAFCEMVRVLGRQNALLSGVVPLGGRAVRLGDITAPFLSIVGEKDHIVPLAAAQGLPGLVGSSDTQELRVTSGHVGLFVGKSAAKGTLPPLCDWMEAHSHPL